MPSCSFWLVSNLTVVTEFGPILASTWRRPEREHWMPWAPVDCRLRDARIRHLHKPRLGGPTDALSRAKPRLLLLGWSVGDRMASEVGGLVAGKRPKSVSWFVSLNPSFLVEADAWPMLGHCHGQKPRATGRLSAIRSCRSAFVDSTYMGRELLLSCSVAADECWPRNEQHSLLKANLKYVILRPDLGKDCVLCMSTKRTGK